MSAGRSPTHSQRLRQLIAGGKVVIAPEATCALTARAVQVADFDAVYVGGAALSAMHYAAADIGVVTPLEFLGHVERICRAVDLPVICDIDQGSEHPLGLQRVIREYEAAGAAAVHIEDSLNPKKLSGVVRLQPIEAYREHIKAAVEARRSSDFIIIARTDVGWTGAGNVDDVIQRGIAAAEAGADLFMPTLSTPEDLRRIRDEVSLPLLEVNPPLESNRYIAVAVHCGYITRALSQLSLGLARRLKETGGYPPLTEDLHADLARLLQLDELVSRVKGANAVLSLPVEKSEG